MESEDWLQKSDAGLRGVDEAIVPSPVAARQRRKAAFNRILPTLPIAAVALVILVFAARAVHARIEFKRIETEAKIELSKWGKAFGAYLDAGGSVEDAVEVYRAGNDDSETPWNALPELKEYFDKNGDYGLTDSLPGVWRLQAYVGIADISDAGAEFPFAIKDLSDREDGGWKTDRHGVLSRYSWHGPWH